MLHWPKVTANGTLAQPWVPPSSNCSQIQSARGDTAQGPLHSKSCPSLLYKLITITVTCSSYVTAPCALFSALLYSLEASASKSVWHLDCSSQLTSFVFFFFFFFFFF
ncbi:hypothetical protein GGI43DRAFT_417577, partial [Trichoderma evansii]